MRTRSLLEILWLNPRIARLALPAVIVRFDMPGTLRSRSGMLVAPERRI